MIFLAFFDFFVVFIVCFLYFKAEQAQSAACEEFEAISAQAKEELLDFKTRRLHAFKKR